MMMLVRVAGVSVMGVRLHVGANALDCHIHKEVRDFILFVHFERNSEV